MSISPSVTLGHTYAVTYSRITMQPVLGALVEGDLCDIRVGRHYCGRDAAREALDVDGSVRLLCSDHVARYFPTEV